MAPTNEELDSEPDEWEEQQVKKAMTALPDITGSIIQIYLPGIRIAVSLLTFWICWSKRGRERENNKGQ